MSQQFAVILFQLRCLQAFYDGEKLKLRWFQDSRTTWPPVGEYKGLSTLHRKCPCHHNLVWIHIFITDIFIYINTYLYKEKEKITHNLKLFSSPQERDEQRQPSSYFFIRCGDSSSAFPESVTDQWARRFIHQESQLHRLFILPRRPTSEARPIKVSHFCPDACHLTQINQKYPSCLALFFMCHLSWFLCLCSITFLTSNEEWIFFLEYYDVIPRSRLQMKCTFWSWVNTQKARRMWGEPRRNHALIPHYPT